MLLSTPNVATPRQNSKKLDEKISTVEQFGFRLNLIKQRLGLTNETLAERVGVSRSTLQNYLSGKTAPDLNVLKALGNTLNIDLNYLILGIGDRMFIDPNLKKTPADQQAEFREQLRHDFEERLQEELTKERERLKQAVKEIIDKRIRDLGM